MATPSYQQTLLNPTTKTKTIHKIILFYLTLLVTLVSLSYYFDLLPIPSKNNNSDPIKTHHSTLCDKSYDPTSWFTLINQAVPNGLETTSSFDDDGRKMLWKTLSTHALDIAKAINVTKRSNNVQRTRVDQALEDCLDLMDLSRDRVHDSIKTLVNYNKNNNKYLYNNVNYDDNDIRTWLSAVLTNHVTCLDQLDHSSHLLGFKSRVKELIASGRVLLEIHAKISKDNFGENFKVRKSYPSWVRRSDRKLLQVSGSDIEADLVVAKDGSGNYTTVGEAVGAVPDRGTKRFVIYVKQGLYVENVEVGSRKTNVMLVGDGMDLTIISGSENVFDGNTTFRSATLAGVGDGFILQDICVENTAGPEKRQAVALRVGSDKSVINRCKFDAYQDTLYPHSLRQFYTKSTIIGTIDFIFGYAAVVLQNCQLIARRPMIDQRNMVTAHGRNDPFQNTGISIQFCDIVAAPDLEPVVAQFPTFLGRPWGEFSRTVVMQSKIGDHIDPRGWDRWDGDFALDTLYYGEFMNNGPGSDTSKRVNWTGYHIIKDENVAKQFTVAGFIMGQEWIDAARFPYVPWL